MDGNRKLGEIHPAPKGAGILSQNLINDVSRLHQYKREKKKNGL